MRHLTWSGKLPSPHSGRAPTNPSPPLGRSMDWKSNLAVLQERFAAPAKSQLMYDSDDLDSPLPPQPPVVHITAATQLQPVRPLPPLRQEDATSASACAARHGSAQQPASRQRSEGGGEGRGGCVSAEQRAEAHIERGPAGRATDEDVMGHHAAALNASVAATDLDGGGGRNRSSRAASEATGSMHSAVSRRAPSSSGAATPRSAAAWQSPGAWRAGRGESATAEADDLSLLDGRMQNSSGQAASPGSRQAAVLGVPPGALDRRWQAFKQLVGR